jgi:hypothetical protein
MKTHFGLAAFAVCAVACLSSRADAGCVIAPDGKSINVVTDNGASDEKNCAVKCQVDTKIGVVQVSCGGTTPPLAKGHSLCAFDKADAYYKRVVSSEDSCKGAAAGSAPAVAKPVVAAPTPAVRPGTFICRIAPDGKSVDAIIANPYPAEASCQVNCRVSTTLAGTTEQSSCTKNVAAGAGEVVLCTHTVDKGRLVKVVGGSGQCYDPTPKPAAVDKDDEDIKKAMQDPAAMQELMRKRTGRAVPPPASARKGDDEDLQKLMDDPSKIDQFIRKQLNQK